MIRAAGRDMENHRKEINAKLGPPTKSPFPKEKREGEEQQSQPSQPLDYEWIVSDILEKGWPKDDKEIGRWLDSLFEGNWAEELRRAVKLPLGVVQDPRITFVD